MRLRGYLAWTVLGSALGFGSCAPSPPPVQEREAPSPNTSISPNASILPAPLASALPVVTPAPSSARIVPRSSASGRVPPSVASSPEASKAINLALLELPSAEPLRADGTISPDSLSPRDATGILLVAEWRWLDTPGPPKVPELFLEGLLAARRLTSFKWLMAAADGGRLRVVFDTRAFPLPLGTELRSRADRLGHALVFPGGKEYRVAPPGSLRALFGDRRLDVLPLSPGEVNPRGNGPVRLGQIPRRFELSSRVGSVLLDLLPLAEPNQGAALLCRLLAELVAVEPSNPICSPGTLPVRAQFSWHTGSGVVFEVHEFSKRMEIPLSDLSCPPFGAQLAGTLLPVQASGVLLTRDEAGALRQRPGEVGAPGAGAPLEGILARNATDSLRYLVVDGVPAAWILPGQEVALLGFAKGRYSIQWRSFLGDVIEPARQFEIPVRIALGEPPPELTPAASASALRP